MLKAELLGDRQLESLGKIKLQPFCGNPINAEWVKLSVSLVKDQCNDEVVTDCAIVSNLNENMILSADVISRLSQCDHKQSCDVCDVNVMNATVDDNPAVSTDSHSDVNLNDNVDNNVVVDNDNNTDVIDDDNHVGTDDGDNVDNVAADSDDLASREVVAREQREDETLKSCFSLAKAGKGGFVFHDGLLYHKKTVLGESFLQLVVPLARRKHVLELGHSVSGGHMAVKRTRERIEYTFYWPTIQADCVDYIRTCHQCQVKKRKTFRDTVPITPIQRSLVHGYGWPIHVR